MQKVYAAFDLKAACYGGLLTFPNRAVAVRVFTEVCNDPKSPMFQYPGDYALHELGDWDPSTGSIRGYVSPEIVCTAASVIKEVKTNGIA